MKIQTNDRNIDDDPTIRIVALRTTSSSAIGLWTELYDPARAELSSDILNVLRLMTPPAPRSEISHLRAVTLPAPVAVVHSRPARKADAVVVLAAMFALVTGTARRLAAIGRRHATSVAKTLSLVATESAERLRRQVLHPLQARWRARVSGV